MKFVNQWTKWGVFCFVLVLFFYLLAPKVLTGLGKFLLVEDALPASLVAISPALSEKIATAYRKGEVSRIYVFVGDHRRSWKALRKFDFNRWVMDRAKEFGIKEEAIQVVRRNLDVSPEAMKTLAHFLAEEKIISAVVFSPYYQTRGFRFFMDRALGVGAESLYVQSLMKHSEENFDHWWLNTALDNLYLDQYLKIFCYYFNEVLGTSIFEEAS
ncbi:MAG: hypothetical protein COV66_12840 [Nitrospinae bacterium CG11_big_fil_rev_8_21_14_0_20_45_15]|nr:MAG: hypothetical protein COV66_12840 [Nitrospinae bacterium CG11_big_fil_rev_8_21_14_0_20_45_15]